MTVQLSPLRFALIFLAVGANFFFISAMTFGSLGVVLPHMIQEFGWTWAEAGLGFTVLALATGISSTLPALAFKLVGPRGNYALGGAVMALGFGGLSITWGLTSFLISTGILGVGFGLLANVAGVSVISEWAEDKHRPMAIGAYLTIGGLGGVAGPLMADFLTSEGNWRSFWQIAALIMAALGVFATSVVAHRADRYDARAQEAKDASKPNISTLQTLREALVTPQFAILIMALTVVYFCGLTVTSFLKIHMTGQGYTAEFAALTLAILAGANSAARALGGLAMKKIRVRYLLVSGLLAEALAMLLLSFSISDTVIILFAILQGYGYGMVLFASTLVQLQYFGHEKSAAMLGFMNLAATSAMIGPVLTGAVGDFYGSFTPVFLAYAAVALICAVLAMVMHSPEKNDAVAEAAPSE
jgi:MFS family permease